LLVLVAASQSADEDVGKTFQERCAKSHTVPDPAIRTDRAWLDQVNRTT
jgi:hypothetical protein